MAISNIEKKVNTWINQQIISEDQGKKILDFENQAPSRSWVAFGVAAIGIVAIVLGIVSIVAANWQAIPNSIKLSTYFVIQSIIGIVAFKHLNQPGTAREVLLTFFALFIFAGIALVGQIFHLQSDGWRAFRFWLILTLPLTLFADKALLPRIWFCLLVYTILAWSMLMFATPWMTLAVPLTATYLTVLVSTFPTRLGAEKFISEARIFGWLSLMSWVVILTNILIVAPDFPTRAHGEYSFVAPAIASAMAALAIFIAAKHSSAEKRIAKLLMAGLILVNFLAFYISIYSRFDIVRGRISLDLIGVAIFMFEYVMAATAAALLHNKRIFDLATLVITIRLIVAYFEVFGSLVDTGVGLILTGIVILGALACWQKLRIIMAPSIARKI